MDDEGNASIHNRNPARRERLYHAVEMLLEATKTLLTKVEVALAELQELDQEVDQKNKPGKLNEKTNRN